MTVDTIAHSETPTVPVALCSTQPSQQEKSPSPSTHSIASRVNNAHTNAVAIDNLFPLDHVFDSSSSTQEQPFDPCTSGLLAQLLDGHDATILANAQTLSEIAHTIDTASQDTPQTSLDNPGVILRTAQALFDRLYPRPSPTKSRPTSTLSGSFPSAIRAPQPSRSSTARLRPVSMMVPPRSGSSPNLSSKTPRYTITVSFVEILNEEIVDLLNTAPPAERASISVHKDSKGRIQWTGVTELPVANASDVAKYLELGASKRNSDASRHAQAIFTIALGQEKWIPRTNDSSKLSLPEPQPQPQLQQKTKPLTIGRRVSTLNVKAMVGQMEKQARGDEAEGEWTTLRSTLYFVDQAGSQHPTTTTTEQEGQQNEDRATSTEDSTDHKDTDVSSLTPPLREMLKDSASDDDKPLGERLDVKPHDSNHSNSRLANEDNAEAINVDAHSDLDKTEQPVSDAALASCDGEPNHAPGQPEPGRGHSEEKTPNETLVTTTVGVSSLATSTSDPCENDQQCPETETLPKIQEPDNQTIAAREGDDNGKESLVGQAAVSPSLQDPMTATQVIENTMSHLESELALAREALERSDKRLSVFDAAHNTNRTALAIAKTRPLSQRKCISLGDEEQRIETLGQQVSDMTHEAMSPKDQLALEQLKLEIQQLRPVSSLSDTTTAPSEQSASPISRSHSVESDNTSQSADDNEMIKALGKQIEDKERQIEVLEQQLSGMQVMRDDLQALRDAQQRQIEELTLALSSIKKDYEATKQQLAGESERRQVLQLQSEHVIQALESKVRDMVLKIEQGHLALEESRQKSDRLEKHMWEQEQSTQAIVGRHLQHLEKVQKELQCLRSLEIKQQAMIQRLETRAAEMDTLTHNLRQQLIERDSEIEHLEKDNQDKATTIQELETKLREVVRNVSAMLSERKQLDLVVDYVDKTLNRQNAKADRMVDALDDLEARCSAQAGELENKQLQIETLTGEKEALTVALNEANERQAKSDAHTHELISELDQTKMNLDQQLALVKTLKEDQLNMSAKLEQAKVYENRVNELDNELATLRLKYETATIELQDKETQMDQVNEALTEQIALTHKLQTTVRCLEESVEAERSIIRSNDMSGRVAELEDQLRMVQRDREQEQQEFHLRFDRAVADLESMQKQNQEQQRVIQALQISLARLDLPKVQQQNESNASTDDDPEVPHAITTDAHSPPLVANDLPAKPETQRASEGDDKLHEKVTQLTEDNIQLVSQVHDLESQLVLQRNKMSLETKNLELEVMRLTSAKNQLEKEIEKLVPRRTSSLTQSNSRDSAIASSPPQSPRMTSPVPGSLHYNMIQREASLNNGTRFRAMILREDSEPDYRRTSSSSIRSDQRSIRSRTISTASIIPPPTAPPSNPLPPVPSALPTLPTPPPSHSPPMPPTRSTSSPHLHRHNSVTTITASETTIDGENLTSERYEQIIRSFQRKMQSAENDVHAHQDVISKLEAQLSRSEHAVREVKRQLELASREKQASSLEIQNLRTQVNQVQSQHELESARIAEQCKILQEQLEAERKQKQKAERARQILENRMEDLMSKKGKFMCF